jgi:F420-0:gamma-glutamyl ligase
MQVIPIKSEKVTSNTGTILSFLEKNLKSIDEKDILVITSKVISLCEGGFIPISKINKEELVINESDYFLPSSIGKHGYHFTIANNTLISLAGVDESNGDDNYILWPKNSQKTANAIRKYLKNRFALNKVGVIISDSTCQPLRYGTTGIALAYTGIKGLKNYVGKPDLFDRPFGVTQLNIAGGLAAAGVVTMGEGSEQTPMCIIREAELVEFQKNDPSDEELKGMRIPIKDDLYEPFLNSVKWQKGRRIADE